MPSDLDKMMSFPFYVFATVCFIILFVFAIVIYDRESKILTIVVSSLFLLNVRSRRLYRRDRLHRRWMRQQR